jgi:phosphopantothenoylcysteine decarboxylase/phosphopantothenate--cysteine ligase
VSRVLLGISGGIAAYKACELVRQLIRGGHEVRVVATQNALHFVSPLTLQTLSGHPVRSDLFDLTAESGISHIELADWADLMVVAPATANVLAQFASGLAGDLLSTICLALRAPLLVAPAMNVNMLHHPATQANLETLRGRGVQILGPASGELACGYEGEGRMVEPPEIAAAIDLALGGQKLRGEVVLVTAGPTAEPVDPVRVLTNRSSGKMGFALAEQAARQGAEVLLIAGPVNLPTPHGVERIDVRTTAEMREAVLREFEGATIIIKAAAPSDYRVAEPSQQKIKREANRTVTLELVENPDICAEVGALKGSRTVVAFAAETEKLLEHARAKLVRKNADLIVANDVSRPEIGFNADRNEVLVIGPDPEQVIRLPEASKREVAAGILERIRELRSS